MIRALIRWVRGEKHVSPIAHLPPLDPYRIAMHVVETTIVTRRSNR